MALPASSIPASSSTTLLLHILSLLQAVNRADCFSKQAAADPDNCDTGDLWLSPSLSPFARQSLWVVEGARGAPGWQHIYLEVGG